MKKRKYLILKSLLLLFSLNSYSNDGVEITPTMKESKVEIVPTFSDDVVTKNSEITSGSDGIISGKKEAVKKTAVVFQYADNSIYQIYAKPDYLTTMRFQAGEKIIFVAGGDTERWQTEQTTGGRENREILLLKPIEENIKTNLVITTDKHTYFINVESTTDKYNPLVEWQYPAERKIIYEHISNNTENMAVKDVKSLNYDYKISNKKYNFSPLLVFDDGEKTYILMKSNLQEMPTFYVKGTDNQLTLVTNRIEGRYVVLDYVTNEIIVINGKKSVKIKNNKK